ncbi:DUF4352 domain-containing protein [Clostridium sp. A1-XYC3]|uniref:DUF4352 domain-containing protein n=1 Tax=Clostridium tanneri TaxID=3037988 RepID=A0ABU4JS01_9CLOT|nr:DUF4352 domain-containing protein [Clostridium sp. A1-XYC3]MDW8800907.1 DUF4352 domain-containing protein [Clostridium sp. A1-XYC3]
MIKAFKKLLYITMVFIIVFPLSACSANPDTTIKGFFDALKKSDIETASKYLNGNTSIDKGGLKFTKPEHEKLAKQVFTKTTYQILSSTNHGDTTIVKTKVTAPDLNSIGGELVTELFPTIFNNAAKGEEISQEKVNKSIIDYYSKRLNEGNIPMTTSEVDIKLSKSKDKKMWLINPDESLSNAMTGNLFKSLGTLESGKMTINPRNNSGVYKVGEEARTGNVAVKVNKVQKCLGDDYVKPMIGDEFVIVTVKERNLSKDSNIDYNEAYYQIQNSKGQIKGLATNAFDRRLDSGRLIPGGEVDGTLTFEVPKDDPQLTLIYNQDSKPALRFKLN